jgi:hypothetical protein
MPGPYDGLSWTAAILAEGKGGPQKNDPGLRAVIRGRVAAVANTDRGDPRMTAVTGTFSIKSGHFASFMVSGHPVTFIAYRNNVQVGMMKVTLDQTDTLIKFDRTFANIDALTIDGVVAMDDLHITF